MDRSRGVYHGDWIAGIFAAAFRDGRIYVSSWNINVLFQIFCSKYYFQDWCCGWFDHIVLKYSFAKSIYFLQNSTINASMA